MSIFKLRRIKSPLSGFIVLVAMSAVLLGCDSNSDAPPTGVLAVSVSTSGETSDPDGYTVTVANTGSEEVNADGSTTFSDVPEGSREVALAELEPNCAADGTNPRSVTVLRGDTTRVSFTVTCRSTTGAIEVRTQTTGETPDEDGFVLTVDGDDSTRVGPNGVVAFRDLSEDAHDVELSDQQVNCTVSGDRLRTVSVMARETKTVSFEVACPRALLGTIAFSGRQSGVRQVYAMDRDGTDQFRVTPHDSANAHPSISPDGTSLAFATGRDGNQEIYTMNVDGTNLTRLTNNPADDSHPTWSPDGSRIAFHSARDGANHEIYAVSADGTDLSRLTDNDHDDTQPAWSPDGSQIAFTTDRDDNLDIYTMSPDGTGLSPVTDDTAGDGTPAWSPDGSRIVFVTTRDGNADLYTIEADGSNPTAITEAPEFDQSPSWSPDGSRIAFQSHRDGDDRDIYLVRPDGTGLTRLTDSPAEEIQPTWGPLK